MLDSAGGGVVGVMLGDTLGGVVGVMLDSAGGGVVGVMLGDTLGGAVRLAPVMDRIL